MEDGSITSDAEIDSSVSTASSLRVAVVGCVHGDIEKVYDSIAQVEKIHGFKTDLVVCCGDFQSLRNLADLDALACPDKYKAMGSFWKYHCGLLRAPCPTVFVGGNHEASAALHTLPHGGWVAPDVLYLGHAGVVRFGGLRIAGVSGIYKSHDYEKGRFEQPPFDQNTMRSCYHLRAFDVFRLSQLRAPVDVFLSHDWPQGIASHGETDKLLRFKQRALDLVREIHQGTLGSPPLWQLLQKLKPSYWFAAHLHCKFAAIVYHPQSNSTSSSSSSSSTSTSSTSSTLSSSSSTFTSSSIPLVTEPNQKQPAQHTKFLSLDKPMPGRDFLQLLSIPVAAPGPKVFEYDGEWLSIVKATHSLQGHTAFAVSLPESCYPTQEQLGFVQQRLQQRGDAIPPEFKQVVSSYRGPGSEQEQSELPATSYAPDPQTVAFAELIDIPLHVASYASSDASSPAAVQNAPVEASDEGQNETWFSEDTPQNDTLPLLNDDSQPLNEDSQTPELNSKRQRCD